MLATGSPLMDFKWLSSKAKAFRMGDMALFGIRGADCRASHVSDWTIPK
jgi:hypothetical protein